MHESEQKEGALAAGVYVQGSKASLDPAYPECADVKASGGWYVSLLPFADEAMVERLQANIMAMETRSPSTIEREGPGAVRQTIEAFLAGQRAAGPGTRNAHVTLCLALTPRELRQWRSQGPSLYNL